ncbi:MAG TPA: type II secretion system protein GspM [Noviherbaspirillum sp.]|nr:type II secretion system protein GspM [Noviherbaspirillum sp.]
MKRYWQQLAEKIDARTLRERVIIFAMAALVLITMVNAAIIDPLFREQKALSNQLQQDQGKISAIQAQIQQKIRSQSEDPDAANREILKKLIQQARQLAGEMNALEKGLVSPDKMPQLLQSLLKRDGKLQLVSLKTLPSASLTEMANDNAKGSTGKANTALLPSGGTEPSTTGMVYKHGVEIVVQGSYLDMIDYMAALEASSWQLFWAKAELDAREYPKASLRLTLYTLSMDKKWLNI